MDSFSEINLSVKDIGRIMKNKFNKNLARLDLTKSQFEILVFLIENQNIEINQKDIEKHFSLTNPTITGLLNRLESKGFITRSVSKNDARYKMIEVTAKALDIEKEMMKYRDFMIKELTKDIPGEDLEKLYEILQKILVNISEDSDI